MQFSNPTAIFNCHYTIGVTVDSIHIFSAVIGDGARVLTFALHDGGEPMQLSCHEAEMHGISTRDQQSVKGFILESIESAMMCELTN